MCRYNNHAIWILITKLRFWGSFLCNTLLKDNGFTCQLLICWVGNGFIYISHFLSILFFCIIGLSREKCTRLRNVQESGQQQLLTNSDNSRAMGSQQTLTLHRQHWGRAWPRWATLGNWLCSWGLGAGVGPAMLRGGEGISDETPC